MSLPVGTHYSKLRFQAGGSDDLSTNVMLKIASAISRTPIAISKAYEPIRSVRLRNPTTGTQRGNDVIDKT